MAATDASDLDREKHPNVGLMIAEIDGEPEWRCSGTLIAPRVFLTAGHCVGDGVTAARVWVDTDLTDNEEYPHRDETSIEGTPVLRPEYHWGDSDPHDVGLVILDKAVDIEPATLPAPDLLAQLKKDRIQEGEYKDGVFFRSVGYGGIVESWPPPMLAYEKIRRVAETEYVALTKVYLHLSQKAVFDESGSCFGDSGGPVFRVHPEGNEIIVAVTSTGDAQCVTTGLNYRVDVPETLEWIIYGQFLEEE